MNRPVNLEKIFYLDRILVYNSKNELQDIFIK